MDWRRNTDFDQCAWWFDRRSILDDGECKEPRTTSIEPPVAKQALPPGQPEYNTVPQLGDIRRDPPRLINGLLTRIPDF
jgi:hypothetical protein